MERPIDKFINIYRSKFNREWLFSDNSGIYHYEENKELNMMTKKYIISWDEYGKLPE